MRKLIFSILAFVLVAGIFAPAALHASEISVTIDGVAVDFDGQQPIIVDGRTLVPVRGVFEALGFEVGWNQDASVVTLHGGGYFIEIGIGNSFFTNHSRIIPLDVPAQIINGRTMLPIRAVLESVGVGVDWDGETQTVAIESIGARSQRLREILVGTWTLIEGGMPEEFYFSSITFDILDTGGMGDGEAETNQGTQRISWLINAYGDLVILFPDKLGYLAVSEFSNDRMTIRNMAILDGFENFYGSSLSFTAVFSRVY